jgi:TetR/AcrR family transcriptional repressor of nem operon
VKKKEQIIQLAIQQVKKESFTHLTFEHLAQQLQITKTAIHYYFKTKNDLGIAMCAYLAAGLEAQYQDYVAEQINSPLAFLDKRLAFIGADEVCPITSFQSDFNEFAPELQQAIQKLATLEVDVFKRVITTKCGTKNADYNTQLFLSVVKGSLYYKRTVTPAFTTSMRHFISTTFEK